MNNNINNIIIDENTILDLFLLHQRKNIPDEKKLSYDDIQRISKYLKTSPFDENICACAIWTGYISNQNNKFKSPYVNFTYNKKKIPLHRILFVNFSDDLSQQEYIKYICPNKGKCCNIKHMKKCSYNSSEKQESTEHVESTTHNVNDINKQSNIIRINF